MSAYIGGEVEGSVDYPLWNNTMTRFPRSLSRIATFCVMLYNFRTSYNLCPVSRIRGSVENIIVQSIARALTYQVEAAEADRRS